jgi:hypothetical protein
MKLIFKKDEKQEMSVFIRNGLAEESFSYTVMIKELMEKNLFEESEFEENITEQEKDSIRNMLKKINTAVTVK